MFFMTIKKIEQINCWLVIKTTRMEHLIKYRNDRKKEGASFGELNGLDGRIHALINRPESELQKSLDLELLQYRNSVQGNRELVARLDAHIFRILGSRPANIVDVIVCSVGLTKKETPVSVDLANETVGDLAQKAAAVLGFSGANRLKLILAGRHLQYPDMLLSEAHIKENSRVFGCGTLGCNGNCCEIGYSMLCDAMLRKAALMKDVPADKLHQIFMGLSRARMGTRAVEAVEARLVSPAVSRLCAMLSEKQMTDEWIKCVPMTMCPTLQATPSNTQTMAPSLPESDNEDLYG